MTNPQKTKGNHWRDAITSLAAGGFLSWCVFEGVRGLLGILERGSIRNRRGPDIDVSENPLVFWTLNGFFGLSILLAAGLAVICLFAAFQAFSRKSVP
ncbi:hypothetical protein [Brevundimonas sp.]|uniref:hypothetical protein n=1 Tax=Brevundimonas sp. TaxID=1871086 RepID=UPI002FCC49B2